MPNRELRVLGARIRALREARGLDQGQLAYKAQISATHVYRLESNERPNAGAVVIARIAAALDTTVEYLVGLVDDPSPLPFGNRVLSPALVARADDSQEQVKLDEFAGIYAELGPGDRDIILGMARMLRKRNEKYRVEK